MGGLSAREAALRLARFGPNALPEAERDPLWRRFARQFTSPLIAVLLFALAFEAGRWLFEDMRGWPIEGLAIALILLLNAALGVYQERRSEEALAHLSALAAAHAFALRDGRLARVPCAELVPGDWVRLEAGDRIPADGILVEAQRAAVDESVLTGESLPIDKAVEDAVSSGTLLVRGTAVFEVTRTGAASALGRIASTLGEIRPTPTPLERRVDAFGRRVAAGAIALTALLVAAGVYAEGIARARETILFAIALAVAAVPEGLPAALTVALALGVERMARERAVVRRLAAVEALGSVTVIASDKTGTLTENRMEVRALDARDPPRALAALVLANDAELATGAGDPLDLALLRHAAAQGADPAALRKSHPSVSLRPFDSAWKFARATVDEGGRSVSYLKGAPEVLIARSDAGDDERASWAQQAEARAREGFRVLGVARAEGETETGLDFLGLVSLWDPPRAEVPGAVRRARAAGIRVLLITGDHPATALAVASAIGLPGAGVVSGDALERMGEDELARVIGEANVFARVRPEQKLRLVDALRARGEVVAMTGDGVNDAPALKSADVGVAMGRRGSDVSREVADLVLLDDNFATIVRAVEEGRGIYENIRKFLRFLFSTNLSELALVVAGAVLAYGLDLRDASGALLLPLTAVQILWINLVSDGPPALALALDRTPGVMRRPPRPPGSPLFDRASLAFVVGAGTAKALLALGLLGLLPRLGYELETTRAAVFHFMSIGQLLLTYPSRHAETHPLPNPYLHAAVFGAIAIQLGAASLPASSQLLGNVAISAPLWCVVFGAAGLSWAFARGISRAARRLSAAA
jgi:Ca2+-transporting ATPase